ncbi:MAG: hypothetical protein U9N61_10015, partial [Euryarchaeota archaeon]|nr:hypothetical protein [Euryarchaeota archaeon]
MAIATEVDFDYVNKRIYRHASATSAIHTVNELYSYVQTVFDDLAQMDDKVPMSAATPTSYKMDNGWYITEEVIRHLEGGAIETTGYTDEIHVLTLDGTYAGPDDANLGSQVTDDAADVGVLLDYDNTAQKWWIRVGSATTIADNSVMSINGDAGVTGDAAGASATGETLFANPYTLGTLYSTLPLYIIQDSTEVTSFWADGHFDVLIKVMEADVDVDSRKITVFGRKWGENYTHFNITLTSAGQNAVPLGTSDDLNVTNVEADVKALADTDIGGDIATGINILFDDGNYSYDIGDGNGTQAYDIQIDCNNQSLADVYEVTKWATRDGSTSQLENYGVADDGQEYISFDAAYAEVVTAPFGTFAGGKFFGARGVYFVNLHADDAQSFQLVDAAGTTRNPPNYQAFSMGGVEVGDSVAVFKSEGASSTLVDKSQYSLSGANALNTLTVSVAIPSSTPETGTIIVVDDDGSEDVYAYSAWSGSDFTVTIAASTYAGTETAYVPFLYETASGTSVTDTTTIYT